MTKKIKEELTTDPKRTLLELTASQLELIAALEESGGDLTPELEARLNINREELNTKICAYQAVMAKIEGEIYTAETQVERLETSVKKNRRNIDRLSFYLLEALKAYGKQDVRGVYRLSAITSDNIVALSTRKSEAIEITDENLLPFEYWRVPTVTAAPDKKRIKEALEDNTPVPGARMVEKLSVVIK